MKKKSKSRTERKTEAIRKGPPELGVSPSNTYSLDLSTESIKKMLTKDDNRDLGKYFKQKDASAKLTKLLESNHHIKTIMGEMWLGRMSRKALANEMSAKALASILPLRAELARELNVTTVSQKMMLEASLVGYAIFMSFQEITSRLCADVNHYSAPVMSNFHRMSLEGLKMFQDTVEMLRAKERTFRSHSRQ